MSDDVAILFDGEHFVAADKPPGWLSVPSRWGERDARPCLGRILEQKLACRLWPVHRLDEEASGVILFAKDAKAHGEANAWFMEHRVFKRYEALTELPEGGSVPAPFEVTWRSKLLRGKKRAYESPHGKPCETRARLVGETTVRGARALAWELEPLTGRPHQLRVELARHGYPILGDALYGARGAFVPDAIALRCVRIDFLATEAAARLGLPTTLEASGMGPWLRAWEPAGG